MTPRTWTCCGCGTSYETYNRDSALTRRLCGRCAAKGQNMTRIMVARRAMLLDEKKRNERWPEQRRKILGIS
jgi:NMD protein affecting ribosome stability and mRNA decay